MNEMNKPRLSDLVPLQEQFVRSTRIDDVESISSYLIYSSTIDQFLKTLAAHQASNPPQGAYTWTGPYGSGKSTLAQSLIRALCGDHASDEGVSTGYPPDTQQALESAFNLGADSWRCLPMIGSKDSFQKRLAESLQGLSIIAKAEDISSMEIVTSIEHFAASPDAGAGFIIIVDEMGKFLEEAVNKDGDVYLFQLLAEAATRSNGRFVFVGILHQSIQEYAASAIKRVRDEWSKVQGRFVDIALNLASAEQVELIANTVNFGTPPDGHAKNCASFVDALSKLKRAPSPELAVSLERAWPLNPTVSYVLGPISKRSYGQNQRSIFSFLRSSEPFGFRRFLDDTPADFSVCAGYSLDLLWDYLTTNWSAVIGASQDAQSFNIVKEALTHVEGKFIGDRKNYENLVRLLKSVHLLELTKHETGLVTNADVLSVALGISKRGVNAHIQNLKDANIVSVRSHNGSIFLHEGSDFDIDAAISAEIEANAAISLSALGGQFLPAAIVAKRHYLSTGSMRWADIQFVSAGSDNDILNDFVPNSGHFARFLLSIDISKSELVERVNSHQHQRRLAAGDLSLSRVEIETIREFEALLRISDRSSKLSKDRIARREVNDRIDIRRNEIATFILEKLSNVRWDVPVLDRDVVNKSLSQVASMMADEVFEDTLILKNELINRSNTSGSAKRASRQFLYDLLQNEGAPFLGYTKFPPERAIFETLLLKNGMYVKTDSTWKLTKPRPEAGDAAHKLQKLFETTLAFLKSNQNRQVELPEIYSRIWQREPFGIKEGLLPILGFIFSKLYAEELIYYQDGIFAATLSEIDVDYFLRAPKYCALRHVSFDKKTQRVLENFAAVPMQLGQPKPNSTEPLDIARSLITIFDALPPWTKKTVKVSNDAKKIRSLFARAIDPAQFILVDLPNLFGDIDVRDEVALNKVVETVTVCLHELIGFQDQAMDDLKSHLLQELGLPRNDPGAFEQLSNRASNVKKMAGDNRMETFITNLISLYPDASSFERLAGMLLNKPSKLWIDNDVERLFVEATNHCRRFNTLETMAHIKGRTGSRQAVSVVMQLSSSSDLKHIDLELSDTEKQSAIALSEKLKSLLDSNQIEFTDTTLAGALALLLDEGRRND